MPFWKTIKRRLSGPLSQSLLHRIPCGDTTIDIFEQGDERWFTFGGGAIQSKVVLRQPLLLPLPYTRGMVAPLLFREAYARVLMLGLGGGSLLRFYHAQAPDSRFTVVDSAAIMTRVAGRYFEAPVTSPRVDIRIADAREAVTGPLGRFDLVMVDVFDDTGLPPWVLERDFCEACAALLQSDGCLIVNLWIDRRFNGLEVVEPLRAAMRHRCLSFHPAASSNLVVMGFGSGYQMPARETLEQRARALSALAGFDGGDLLRRLESMHPDNRSVLAG